LRFLRKVAAPRAGGETTDAELLERFAATSEEAAFTALVQRHGPMVFGVCRSILQDADDADDAFQATFLVLVKKATSIAKAGSVASWLHGVAYRIASKARGAAARRRQQERQAPIMSGSEPEHEAVWRDLRPLLHAEIEHLPERYRKPFVLCYLEGKTNEEAAQILGWPKGTVLSSLSRARERLRERLTRRGVALPAAALATLLAQSETPAAVPAGLLEATVRSAVLYSAGAGAAGISAGVLAHTQGMLHSMLLGRIKTLTTWTLLAAVIGSTGALVAYHARSSEPSAAAAESAKPSEPPGPTEDSPEAIVAPAEVPVRADKELLRGTWIVVSGEQHGLPVEEVKEDRLMFFADDFSMDARRGELKRLFRRGVTKGTYEVSSPRALDLMEAGSGRKLPCIFRIEDDRLTLCVGDPDTRERPTGFATGANDRRLLLVLKRQ
jgi:RNA polymerase sigma factor (sigma-70 family)